jgi:hypothetical protein
LVKKVVRYRWIGVFAVVLFLFGLILKPVVTGLAIFKNIIDSNISLLFNIAEAVLVAVAIFVMINYFNDRNRISFGKEAITVKKPSSFAFVRKAGKRFKNKLTRMISDMSETAIRNLPASTRNKKKAVSEHAQEPHTREFSPVVLDRPEKEVRWSMVTSVKKREELPVHKIEEKKMPEPDKKKKEESGFSQIMKERVYNYLDYRKRQDEKKAEAQKEEPKEKIMLKKSAESRDKIKEKMLNNLNEVYGK